MKHKALFAVSSLWLWHATRTLIVIDFFLKKWFQISIISYWNALNFLKAELAGKNVDFIELKDYPAIERGKGVNFYLYLFNDIIKITKLIRKERSFVEKIYQNYDFIFSDWRYWIYSKKIPSFLLSHQISFVMPKWLELFYNISDYLNYRYLKNFDLVFIPDYEKTSDSLTWELSHPKWIKKINHKYVWILSSYKDLVSSEQWEKIDYLFLISWYLNDYRENFIDNLVNQAKNLPWKKVFVLWDTKNNYVKELENNITIYSFLFWDKRRELFLKADTIISRLWYTTIMDLVELWKKAVLFPTPNQTEQEYLKEFLDNKNIFTFWRENSNLLNLIEKNKKIENKSFNFWKTEESLLIIDKIISNYI